jgi:hypothetical protein
MTTPELPDAKLAREQSNQVRERVRKEKLEHKRQLQIARSRALVAKKERNRWVKDAIQHAAQGNYFLICDTLENDVKDALETMGFFIETTQDAFNAVVTEDLYDFWDENCLPQHDFSSLLEEMRSTIISSIYFASNDELTKDEVDEIARELLEEYYLDANLGRTGQLLNKLTRLTRIHLVHPVINPIHIIYDKNKRASFERTDIGKSLKNIYLNEDFEVIREIAAESIDRTKEQDEEHREFANGVSSVIEEDLLQHEENELLISWYRFPYIRELGVEKFAETLFWLACTDGQEMISRINLAITASINEGLMTVDIPLAPMVKEKMLAIVIKHFLQGKGYKALLSEPLDPNFTITVAWD